MNTRPILLVTAVVVAVQLVLAGYALTQLSPDARIAIHWGVDGRPNGYADAWLGLLLLPVTTVVLGPFLAYIPRFDPRAENLARSGSAYRWIVGSALILLGAVQVFVVLAALGNQLDVTRFVGVAVGALFVVIGNFLGKTRSSWFLGIRTPWTLSSDRSWALTHRLGGYLFIATGLLSAVVAFVFPAEVFFWVLMIGLVGTVSVLFVYSYFAWRSDPDRRTL
jgi:immunity protein, SdpI family